MNGRDGSGMSSATRVQFYHNALDPLALARELLARALASGCRIAVRLPDAASASAFDRQLWVADAGSFVPHVLAGSPLADETPVVLGAADAGERWPHHDILFNLASDVPPAYRQFRQLVEIVGCSEADKQPARARWLHYKRDGLRLQAFDAELRTAL